MPAPFSVQLFSVRDEIAEDLPGTLARIAAQGWTDAEPYGFGDDPAEWTAELAMAGLRAPTAHTSLTGVDVDALLGRAEHAGISTLIDPWSDPDRWTDRCGVESLAAEFGRLAERAADRGIRIGYHNHDLELRSRIDDRPALEVFADALDDRVVLQLDCYWAQAAGVDPVALLGRLGARVTALHLKDGDGRIDAHSKAALGGGTQPIRELLAAAPSALRVVELDDPAGDVWIALAQSLRWLEENDA